jgi:hypothetical protein
MSGDAYPDNTLLQYNSRQLQHGFTNSIHATSFDKIEMKIGHWYIDEFGNRTREITTRDAAEEVQVRALPEPQNRNQTRTAAARLAQLAAI